jgi:hypothetical protein
VLTVLGEPAAGTDTHRATQASGARLGRPNYWTGRSPKDVLDECIRSHRSAAGARPYRVLFSSPWHADGHVRRGDETDDDFVTAAAACELISKEAVPGRLALSPGAQCVRGSFTEQLTILAGKPAKVHEPPAACNHGYRDQVRRVSGEFCVHTV